MKYEKAGRKLILRLVRLESGQKMILIMQIDFASQTDGDIEGMFEYMLNDWNISLGVQAIGNSSGSEGGYGALESFGEGWSVIDDVKCATASVGNV